MLAISLQILYNIAQINQVGFPTWFAQISALYFGRPKAAKILSALLQWLRSSKQSFDALKRLQAV